MKSIKIGLLFCLVIFYSLPLHSIEPIVNVPSLPRNLRNYVTDEVKYFETLIDYYLRAKLLESQLGIDTVQPISYTYVQNQDLAAIRNYYNVASSLWQRVKNLPESARFLNCQQNLNKLLNENMLLKIENDSLTVVASNNETYRKLISLRDSIIQSIQLNLIQCEEEISLKYLKMLERPKYSAFLGLNCKAAQWFFDNPRVNTYMAPSLDFEIHLFKVAKDVLGFKFSSSYTYLTNVVEFTDRGFTVKHTYKDDIWNFSTIFYVNLSRIINSHTIHWEIDLHAGYFRGFTKSPTPFTFQNDYKGYSFGFYSMLGGFGRQFPLGVILGASFYKYIDEIGYDGLRLGKPFVPNVFVGFNVNVFNSF